MGILNKDLVNKALKLAEPSILAILNEDGMTWGPEWVVGYITGPGLSNESILFQFGKDYGKEWKNADWGNQELFFEIARAKLKLVMREKMPSSVIAASKPWILESGEFLYTGGYYLDGIGVAVSGAMARTDEACAKIIHICVTMLAFLEAEKRIKENRMEI